MDKSYSDFKKPKSKFMLSKEAQEEEVIKKFKEEIAIREKEEQDRLDAIKAKEKIIQDKLDAERQLYKDKIKKEYSPEKMMEEVKDMVDCLAKYDKKMIKQIIETFYQEEVKKLIDTFEIVFEDFPNDDPMKNAISSLIQISMGQKIGDASHPELSTTPE
jgi:hypothetical protein